MTLRRVLLSAIPLLGLASIAMGSRAVSRGGSLWVNGVSVLTVRTGAASARAAEMARILSRAKDGLPVVTQSRRRTASVRLGSSLLATISKAEAAANGLSAAGLAARWAQSLRSALALPPVKVLVSKIEVPLGGTREVRLVGSRAHLANWRSVPPGSFQVTRTLDGVSIQGRSLGRASLIFSAGTAEADLDVAILPLAASFPQNLHANVSGLPAQRDSVVGAVETSIRTQLRRQSGAKLNVNLPAMGPLLPGEAKVVAVRVRAEAPGCYPTEGIVQVAVRNLGLGAAKEEELWYSNHPENLAGPGLLMAGSLASEKPVRLLYHHINESPQGLYVLVEASNPTDRGARVLVIPGDAEPDRNPVLAGIVAGERFLRRWLASSGEVIEVPAHSRVPIALRRLAPKETMSGLCSLWLLEDGPNSLDVKVTAQPPSTPEAGLSALTNVETPWRVVAPFAIKAQPANLPTFEQIYPAPFKLEELSHSVGGRHGFVRIGQNPISRLDQNGSLDGNFGVLYRIAAYAENPSEGPADLEVAFEASAGYSGALFVLNGEVIRTPLLQPKTSVRILRMRLSPGQAKRFELLTMPLSGSSYPATVTMRPIEPGNRLAADLSDRWLNKL